MELQGVSSSSTIGLRLLGWGATGTSGTGFLNQFQTGNDFAITGWVAPAGTSTIWTGTGSPGTWSDGGTGQFAGIYANNLANTVTFTGTGGMVTASGTPQAGNLFFNADSYTLAGALQLGVGGITTAGSATANITADIGGNGPSGLAKGGTGTLILSGPNSYTGTTTLNSGTLVVGNADALGPSGNITFSGGALQYGSGIATDISARIKNSASAIVLDTNGNTVSFGAGIDSTNSGGLSKTGAGTLVLNGNNTLSGPVQVLAGTLATGAAGGFSNSANISTAPGAVFEAGAGDQVNSLDSSGTLVLSSGTLVVSSSTADSRIHGTLSGNGGLTKGGASTLSITANNSGYSGQVRLEGGVLEIGHDAALGTGTFSFRESSTLRPDGPEDRTLSLALGTFTGANQTVYTLGGPGTGNLSFTGTGSTGIGSVARIFEVHNTASFQQAFTNSGSLAKTGNGTLILAGNNTYTGATTIQAGTLQIGNGGTAGRLSANSAITANATLAFNRAGTVAQGTDFHATIAGTGAVAQIGTGTLTLNGTNTHSGGTFLNSGTLDLRHAAALGSGNFTISGGTLANNSGASLALSTDNPQNWTGNFAFSGTGDLDLGTGEVKLNGARTVDVASGNLTVGGTVSNAGSYYSGGLAKEGAGTLRFTGNLSYGGTNTVNNGTVVLAGTGAGGSSTVVNGGTLRTEGGGRIGWGDLAIGAGGSVSLAGSQAIAALSGSGNLSISGALSLGGGGSGVFSGVVAGNGSLVVPETKVLVLSGNNSYSGGTRVAGNLFVGSDNALGTGPLQMGDGGFLWTPPARLASADAEDRTIANAISAFDSEPESIIFGQAGTGNLTFTSTAAASLWGIPWIKIENQSTKLHNSLAGSGGGLTKLGTGDLILAGNNTHTGETRIYQGLLAVEGGQAIANTAAVKLDNTDGAVFEVRSSETIGSLRGGGTTGGLASILSGQTLTVAEAGNNTYSGATGGAGALVKSGNGTLALGGDAGHSGGTTVGGGTLRINGTHASAITVQSGATLGGNGSIAGMVALNANANLAPGNSVGTLTFSNGLTLNSTSTVTMEINGADSFDSVNVTGGTLGYAGTLSLVFGYGAEVGDTYNLFVRSGGAGYSGTFGALLFNYGGYAGEFDAEAGSLTLTAVPEPQIWCLIALGCAFLLLRMRRRGNAARP